MWWPQLCWTHGMENCNHSRSSPGDPACARGIIPGVKDSLCLGGSPWESPEGQILAYRLLSWFGGQSSWGRAAGFLSLVPCCGFGCAVTQLFATLYHRTASLEVVSLSVQVRVYTGLNQTIYLSGKAFQLTFSTCLVASLDHGLRGCWCEMVLYPPGYQLLSQPTTKEVP